MCTCDFSPSGRVKRVLMPGEVDERLPRGTTELGEFWTEQIIGGGREI
jgi:hypothetical protein